MALGPSALATDRWPRLTLAVSLTVSCPSLNSAHTFNAAALSLKLCSVPDSPPAGLQSQAVPLCWLPVTKGALGIKVSHPPSAWERQSAPGTDTGQLDLQKQQIKISRSSVAGEHREGAVQSHQHLLCPSSLIQRAFKPGGTLLIPNEDFGLTQSFPFQLQDGVFCIPGLTAVILVIACYV